MNNKDFYFYSLLPILAFAAIFAPFSISPKETYLFGAREFFTVSFVLFFLANFFRGFSRVRSENAKKDADGTWFRGESWLAAGHGLFLLGFTFFSYGWLEIFFSRIDLRLNVNVIDPGWKVFFQNFDGYFLNRSYQYIPVIILWLSFRWIFGSEFQSNIGLGDLKTETTILGDKQPMSWGQVGFRVGGILILLGLLNAAMRISSPVETTRFYLFGARILGGFNNSLIEEMVFRGLLLPAFLLRIGPRYSNFLQAAFFSVIHYTFIDKFAIGPILQETFRLGLFFGIGLFFGRAAMETKGIGWSVCMHFLITTAIWMTLTLAGME